MTPSGMKLGKVYIGKTSRGYYVALARQPVRGVKVLKTSYTYPYSEISVWEGMNKNLEPKSTEKAKRDVVKLIFIKEIVVL